MLNDFEKTVWRYCLQEGLLAGIDSLLLAVSGGADSTALLNFATAARGAGLLDARLIVVHINHRLRGAAAQADERFVLDMAADHGLEAVSVSVDAAGYAKDRKLSIETAARELRIRTLRELCAKYHSRYVATGHQKNDNAETVIQRLARGTGFRGLAGIWPERQFGDDVVFVRPLPCVTREQVITYLHERGIDFRRDHTNAQLRFRRNYIRHRLMPYLQSRCRGSLVEKLFELSQACRAYCLAVDSKAAGIWPEIACDVDSGIAIDAGHLASLPEPVQVALIRRGLCRLGTGLANVSRQHYRQVMALAAEQTGGKEIQLPEKAVVGKYHDKLIFSRKRPAFSARTGESRELAVPGTTAFQGRLIETRIFRALPGQAQKAARDKPDQTEWFDFDKLAGPLRVRLRQPGDRFRPLGMAREKKIGKFITDQKVPYPLRNKLLVFEDAGRIIWLSPVRMAEEAKIDADTGTILAISVRPCL